MTGALGIVFRSTCLSIVTQTGQIHAPLIILSTEDTRNISRDEMRSK